MRSGYTATPEVLAAVRILFCLHLLIFGLIPIAWLGDLPEVFFRPPLGPMQLIGEFPSRTLGQFLDGAGIVLVVMVGIGLWTRASSILLFGWAITTSAFLFSLGKVDHSLIWWTVVPLLGIAGWGDAFSIDRLRSEGLARIPRPSWPLPTLAFILAFGYLTAALPKLGRGWLSPDSQAVERYMKDLFVSQGRDELLADRFASLESPVLWELLDWWTVAFELGIALTVLWPPVFRRLLLLAAIFHVVVLLVMNISFTSMMFVYAPLLARGGASSLATINAKVVVPASVALFVALGAVSIWSGPPRDLVTAVVPFSELSLQAIIGALLAAFVGFTYYDTRPIAEVVEATPEKRSESSRSGSSRPPAMEVGGRASSADRELAQ